MIALLSGACCGVAMKVPQGKSRRMLLLFKGTLWLFNIAMENGPFIDDFPIKTSIYKGFSMAMLNNQMVYISGWWFQT
jgi:hypothetical protein